MIGRISVLSVGLAAIAFAALTLPDPAAAQEAQEASAPGAEAGTSAQGAQEPDAFRFGVGFQSSWPAWGLSGTIDVTEQVTAQAIVGAFGTLTTVGARGIYRFTQEETYNMYGYGTVGMWRYPGIIRENVVGFGGGAGIEFDWRRIFSNQNGTFPPLFTTIDLGLVVANFEHYDFSGFTVGSGLHYRF